jgi:hypothetical protein
MARQDGSPLGWAERWRPAVVPTFVTGLVLLERVLTEELGSPATLLRALGEFGRPWTDPVASVMAVMALTVEALIGYVLAVLVLGSLCELPGPMGRLAARLTSLLTPVVVRRLLDLLVGGALLAQATLATPGAPPGHRWSASHLASTGSSASGGPVGPAPATDPGAMRLGPGWLGRPPDATEPVEARPNPRRSAAPLPPWLGGGPSTRPGHRDGWGDTAGTRPPRLRDGGGRTALAWHVVVEGDTLWDIAAARLRPGERSAANIHRYWQQVYRANRSVIGPDPDLIHPGTRLRVPPFRRTRP